MEDVAPTAAQALSVAYLLRICQIIPSTIVLYDHLITLDQEIDLVWVRPWSPAKFLFLWNRYLGTIFLLSNTSISFIQPTSDNIWYGCWSACSLPASSCRSWAYIELFFISLIIWSMQFIMLVRTMALFKRHRPVLCLCIITFICEIVAMGVIISLSFNEFHATDDFTPAWHACLPDRLPSFLYGMWIPAVLFECFLFSLVLWVCLRHLRNVRAVNDVAKHQMWETLLGDSILYFLLTSTSYLLAVVFWLALPAAWFQLPQPFSIAATTVSGTRVILNLREAYYFPPPRSDEELDVHVSTGLVMRLHALPAKNRPSDMNDWRVCARNEFEDANNWKSKSNGVDGSGRWGSNTVLELRSIPSGVHERERRGESSKS